MSTTLSISQARADLLAQVAVRHNVESVAALRQLRQFAGWREEIFAEAVDRNVADGVFTEDAHGRLCVVRKSEAAPGKGDSAKPSVQGARHDGS